MSSTHHTPLDRWRSSFRGLLAWLDRARGSARFAREILFAARYVVNVFFRGRVVLLIDRTPPGIGDLLSIGAAAHSVRTKNPNAWLVLSCAPQNRALAEATKAFDGIVCPDDAGHLLIKRRQHVALFARLPDEEDPPRFRPRRHLAAEFAAALDAPPPTAPSPLHIPTNIQRRIDRAIFSAGLSPATLLVVHTGPTWPVKEWPAESWRELATLVREHLSLSVIQVGNDIDSAQKTRRAARWPHAFDWVNRLSLLETAAVVSRARIFLGIDSGPMHLASSLRRPVVGLFGPTDGSAILFPSPFNQILHAKVPCIGCHHDPGGPGHWLDGCRNHIACMRTLSAAEVFAALAEQLGRPGHSIIAA